MPLPFIADIQYAARTAARRAVFGTAAGLLMMVGAVFLTIAAWIYLAAQLGAMQAALIIGLCYFGVGLIVLAVGLRRPRLRHSPHQVGHKSQAADTAALLNAFLGGLTAGRGLRKR